MEPAPKRYSSRVGRADPNGNWPNIILGTSGPCLWQIFIFRTREKEELIRRLSTNHATADIFKNTTNMRKFSTQSIRGDPTLSMTMDSQGRNTLSNTPSSHSNKERSRKSSVLTLINTDGVQDPVRLRKFQFHLFKIRPGDTGRSDWTGDLILKPAKTSIDKTSSNNFAERSSRANDTSKLSNRNSSVENGPKTGILYLCKKLFRLVQHLYMTY